MLVRLSDEEGERADRLARHHGLRVADVVRMLLKREHDAVFGRDETLAPPVAEPSSPRVKKTTARKR